MHTNVLNLDRRLLELRNEMAEEPEALRRWMCTTVKRVFRSADFEEQARQLAIDWRRVILPHEHRVLKIVAKTTLLNLDHYRVLDRQEMATHYPWVPGAVAEGNDLLYIVSLYAGRVQHLAHAIQHKLGPREDYRQVTLADALRMAREWQDQLDRDAKRVEGRTQLMCSEVREVGGALHLWELLDKQAFVREGFVMHHCVGSYDVQEGRRIFSLRTTEGQSLATAELQKGVVTGQWHINQIRGLANDKVPDDLEHYLRLMLGKCPDLKVDADLRVLQAGYGVLHMDLAGNLFDRVAQLTTQYTDPIENWTDDQVRRLGQRLRNAGFTI